jgi:YVTN family beta-propeller protein
LLTAYVVNYFANTVTPISTATGKAREAITVGSAPGAIAITLNGKTAYVASGSGVTPISTATGKAGPGHQGQQWRHRDHAEREDRLRLQRLLRHGHPDSHRHRQGTQGDQGRDRGQGPAAPHRDHAEREDGLRH